MKRFLATTLAAALALASMAPVPAMAAGRRATGSIAGTVTDSERNTLPGCIVRARSMATGELAGTQQTDARGQFLFPALAPGAYILEVVDGGTRILGASGNLVVAADVRMEGIVIVLPDQKPAAATRDGRNFFKTRAGIVTVAAGAGIGAIALGKGRGSPSK